MSRLEKLLFSILVCLWSSASFGQELFVVHAHKHYIKKSFSSFRQNEFSRNLKQVNNYFCENDLDTYWVYDTDFFPKRRFPIKKCGAKKLKSKWGDITASTFKFSYSDTVVLAGIYFGNCVSRTYRSIFARFAKDQQKSELNVHVPMPATISYYDLLLAQSAEAMINHKHFLESHNLTESSLSLTTEVYFNGALVKRFVAKTNPDKLIRLHLWDNMIGFFQALAP